MTNSPLSTAELKQSFEQLDLQLKEINSSTTSPYTYTLQFTNAINQHLQDIPLLQDKKHVLIQLQKQVIQSSQQQRIYAITEPFLAAIQLTQRLISITTHHSKSHVQAIKQHIESDHDFSLEQKIWILSKVRDLIQNEAHDKHNFVLNTIDSYKLALNDILPATMEFEDKTKKPKKNIKKIYESVLDQLGFA